MTTHWCDVCGSRAEQHRQRDDYCGEFHWPPLCCPGCLCRSHEEAHLVGDHEADGKPREAWLVGGNEGRVVHLPARPGQVEIHGYATTLCRRVARWGSRPPRLGQRLCRRCEKVWARS